jgi:hypothetical protein
LSALLTCPLDITANALNRLAISQKQEKKEQENYQEQFSEHFCVPFQLAPNLFLLSDNRSSILFCRIVFQLLHRIIYNIGQGG